MPDFEQTIERLWQHQVEMPGGIFQGDGVRWVLFHDPAGNLVELTEFTPS